MKAITKSCQIQMPLSIGSCQLMSNSSDKVKINSLDYNISLSLDNDTHLKNFIKKQIQGQQFICNYKFKSQKQIEIFNQENQDLLELNTPLNNKKNIFPIFKEPNAQNPNIQQSQLPFRVEVSELEKSKFKMKIIQENFTFQLIKLNSNSVKFVRNKLLSQLLNFQSQQQKGLLTMDQASRFLVQSIQMPFPVIGFWLKNQQDLTNIQVMFHFVQFANTKYKRKCVFKASQSDINCFYFVRLTKQKRMQTYIVSWTFGGSLQRQFQIQQSAKLIQVSSNSLLVKKQNIINTNSNQQKSLSSSENSSRSIQSLHSHQNGMDFTLREYKHKKQLSTLESLISYSYLSPIKHLQDQENQQDIFAETHQNSPQFSTLMKSIKGENQCVELRTKVKYQEAEIRKLNKIIAQMQSQLKLYKNSRMSTHYESNCKKGKFSGMLSSSPQTNQFSLGSNSNLNNSSPQEIKRLRESDLRSNSISRSGSWLKNSSKKKSLESRCQSTSGSKQSDLGQYIPSLLQKEYHQQKLYQPLPQILEEDARDPWDYMEIIED